ncbi:hypothetical protein ACUBH7_000730 [Vibrio fluvialis]
MNTLFLVTPLIALVIAIVYTYFGVWHKKSLREGKQLEKTQSIIASLRQERLNTSREKEDENASKKQDDLTAAKKTSDDEIAQSVAKETSSDRYSKELWRYWAKFGERAPTETIGVVKYVKGVTGKTILSGTYITTEELCLKDGVLTADHELVGMIPKESWPVTVVGEGLRHSAKGNVKPITIRTNMPFQTVIKR